MPKSLVIGASGFIGSHIVRALRRRGDEVRAAIRPGSTSPAIERMDVERVTCDVTDAEAVRRALQGVDRLFCAAGLVSLHPRDRDRLFTVHVTGTRTVLGEALGSDVERVVYVSAATCIGHAEPGEAIDETHLYNGASLGIPYVTSKREAEVEAMRLAAKGLPLVCVNPTWAMGPGDARGSSLEMLRRFLEGRFPAYVGGGVNVVDVRDVARGALQADRKGRIGERYILGGRNFTTDRLVTDLARIAGLETPPKIPASVAMATAQLAQHVDFSRAGSVEEARAAACWWTYRSTKAQRKLGFRARPHDETLEDMCAWMRDHPSPSPSSPARADTSLRLAARALELAQNVR